MWGVYRGKQCGTCFCHVCVMLHALGVKKGFFGNKRDIHPHVRIKRGMLAYTPHYMPKYATFFACF